MAESGTHSSKLPTSSWQGRWPRPHRAPPPCAPGPQAAGLAVSQGLHPEGRHPPPGLAGGVHLIPGSELCPSTCPQRVGGFRLNSRNGEATGTFFFMAEHRHPLACKAIGRTFFLCGRGKINAFIYYFYYVLFYLLHFIAFIVYFSKIRCIFI